MLRRLHPEQPDSFAFTPANAEWAQGQISKYPEGRQASAIIPLLWRAQEQEGWLTRPAIEGVAEMLDLPYIRALEVATFYFMYQLQPVGSVAHVQVCGTTSCMICGAEDLISVCQDKIAASAHEISADGKFSWEEVECLGACTNAPMVQIGKDFYEDLTVESFSDILDAFSRGEVPRPGPQNGRFASEPKSGLSSLTDFVMPSITGNGSVARAEAMADTVKRIDGTDPDYRDPSQSGGGKPAGPKASAKKPAPIAKEEPVSPEAATVHEAEAVSKAKPKTSSASPLEKALTSAKETTPDAASKRPEALKAARDGKADDLKLIKGVGPKLEKLCNSLGFYHFDQIAAWKASEIKWVDENLEGFKGRVTRDDWVRQAKILAKGGETEFSAKNRGRA